MLMINNIFIAQINLEKLVEKIGKNITLCSRIKPRECRFLVLLKREH